MKKCLAIVFLLFIATLFVQTCEAAETKKNITKLVIGSNEVATTVEKVTVFGDRALVERSGTINIPAGTEKLTIQYLPQQIDQNSVRVTMTGTAPATLGGVEVFFDRFTPEMVKILKDSIQSIDDRMDELKAAEDGLDIRRQFLQSIAKLGGSQAENERLVINPQNLTATAKFLEEQLQQIAKSKTEIAVERRELKKKKDELTEQLNNITGGSAGRGFRVEVPIENRSSGQFTVTVRYVVFSASWKPEYDARYDESKGKVLLSYYGSISQRTGEDWENCRIVLSTAQPQFGTEPPQLWQWVLRKFEPRPMPKAAMRKGGAEMMMLSESAPDVAMAPAPAQDQFEAEYQTATANISGETVIFEISGKRTIPADGQQHRVVVAETELETQKMFVTVPKLDPKVYLTAKCKNTSGYLLLPGKVSVFQGNEYVGTQFLGQSLGFDEEVIFAMGPVQTIKVERKRVSEFNEKTGIIGQNKREFYKFEITITNNSKSVAEIELVDQIPYSAHEDIKIEDVQFDPAPSERDKKYQGEVIWRTSLNPAEKKVFMLQFAIKYPKDIVIEGL